MTEPHPIQLWASAELAEVEREIEAKGSTSKLRYRQRYLHQVAYRPTARQKLLGVRKGCLRESEAVRVATKALADGIITELDRLDMDDLKDHVMSYGKKGSNRRLKELCQ